jgi:predicted kinase
MRDVALCLLHLLRDLAAQADDGDRFLAISLRISRAALALRGLAARLGVEFAGLWLEASMPDLVSRVSQRVHDASDANADIVALQAEHGIGLTDWHRIDAGSDATRVLAQRLVSN